MAEPGKSSPGAPSEVEDPRARLERLELEHAVLLERVQHAQEERRVAEERYRRLAQAVTDYIYTARVEGGHVVETRHGVGCATITGYTGEDFAADPLLWHRMILAEDRPLVEDYARRILAGEPVAPIEHRITHKNGSLRWIRNTLVPRCDTEGRLLSYDGLIRDITERRQAEEALRASEERFRRTFDEAPVGAAIVGLDSRFQRVNAELCRITGYGEEELLRMTFGDITHPDDLATSLEESRRLFAGEIERMQVEKRYIRKDGSVVWARTSARVIRDAQGRPLYSLPLVEDVTERKQADERLALFKHSIDATSDAAYWLDPDGSFVYISDSGCQVLGYERAELERLRVFDVNPRATPDAWRSLWERLRNGTRTVHVESVHRRRNGDLFPVDITSTYVRFGEREYLCGFARDITERKRAESALRESEERWRALFENAPVVIGTVDRGGRILSLNRRHGPSGGPVAGEMAYAFAGAEAQALLKERLAEVFDGRPVAFELEYAAPDGGRGVDYVSLAPIRDGGSVVEAVLVTLDMTERRRAEEERERLQAQLIQAQKMEAVGRLAGGVAHDFNNLLTAIIGYSELAFVGMDQDDPSAQNVAGIRDAVQQAKALTQQILAFSRRQVLTMSTLDLNAEVLAAGTLLRRLIGEHIAVETRLASPSGRVRADAYQLRQVLVNLAVNARDAMPEGGRLTLSTAHVSLPDDAVQDLGQARPGDYVLLAVEDTGTGMDAETQGHLFEPFFTTKEAGRGTGLGLATVYGIVRQHGGHIAVRSAPGAGTAFRILLPTVTDEPRRVAGETATAALGRGREVILVVEDEPAVLDLTCQGLSAGGYQVLSAASPAQALDMAGGHAGSIDLLLTDVVMPGMNGRELYNRLIGQRPRLRVLFMSGYAGDAFAPQGGVLEEGLHFIQKPFGLAELTRKMRQVLDSRP